MSISGLLNINKHPGVTSFWVVRQVKKILNIKKVGHCGTLDPMAEGVLIVVYGKSTKLQNKVMSGKKVYLADILLGTVTDTADITGKIISESHVSARHISSGIDYLKNLNGEITQYPPMYSAVKHEGRRLYEYARQGITVERKPRKVNIYSLSIIETKDRILTARIECSSGTYIRTIAEDLGKSAGCGAVLKSLVREKIGIFDIKDSISSKCLHEKGIEYLTAEGVKNLDILERKLQ